VGVTTSFLPTLEDVMTNPAPRPWNILELAAGNALGHPGNDGDETAPIPTGRRVVDPDDDDTVPPTGRRVVNTGTRTVRRIPTAAEQNTTAWRSTDRWTREVVRQIARLGGVVAADSADWGFADLSPTESAENLIRVYLVRVGRSDMSLTLSIVEAAGGIVVRRVQFGERSFTARQAALWLRQRVAR
jgi:hypothetical protein